MSAITIHAEDYLALAIKEYAVRAGQSVNSAVKELVAGALGLVKPPRKRHDFSEYCGILKKGDADAIRKNMEIFERIDEESWR